MYSVSDFRRGLPILVDDEPYYIVEFQHFKMGRGKANVRTKLKHIRTGSVVEKVFGTSDSFRPPDLEKKDMQFLYENLGEYSFMDSQTFEQITIPEEQVGDAKWYIKENESYPVQFLDNEVIGIDLPTSVVLEVVETEPAVKGDTVTNVTKPAKLDGGLEVKVPPFIKEGDMVKVDTRTGEYLERSN